MNNTSNHSLTCVEYESEIFYFSAKENVQEN